MCTAYWNKLFSWNRRWWIIIVTVVTVNIIIIIVVVIVVTSTFLTFTMSIRHIKFNGRAAICYKCVYNTNRLVTTCLIFSNNIVILLFTHELILFVLNLVTIRSDIILSCDRGCWAVHHFIFPIIVLVIIIIIIIIIIRFRGSFAFCLLASRTFACSWRLQLRLPSHDVTIKGAVVSCWAISNVVFSFATASMTYIVRWHFLLIIIIIIIIAIIIIIVVMHLITLLSAVFLARRRYTICEWLLLCICCTTRLQW